VSNEVVSLVTLVSIITFAVSSYAIARSNSLYRFLQPYLGIFEIKRPKREEIGDKKTFKNHIVLVGANRVGQSILDSIKDLSEKIVVVDFDPDIIRELKEARVDAFFGDITDLEIQEIAQIASAKLIVSTVSDFEDNLLLVKGIRHENQKIKIIVVAQDQGEAEELYRGGVDYVVLPHLAGGRHIAKILSENNIDQIGTLREKDLKALKPTFA
ncbi:MAG: NAD-binding protein, partial [bacterium]|nr:NAD-binding protein [bacterium]